MNTTNPTGDGSTQPADEAALHEPAHRNESGETPDARKADAEKILARNKELIDGEAEAGPEGEREVGVGQTVNSDSSHHGGDYSSD